MALLINKNEYTSRMNSSMKYKQEILPHIVGEKVLDFGCGTGMLTSLIKEKRPLSYVVGYDNSKEMLEIAQTYGDSNVKFTNVFPTEHFDTIILSGVLHEVFSYENGMSSVIELLKKLKDLLYENGKIIVRECLLVDKKEKLQARFTNQLDGFDFYSEYSKQYKWKVPDLILDRRGYKIVGCAESVLEFLNKYTWGWQSLPREINEKVYFADFFDWTSIEKSLELTMAIRTVLQKDYYKFLNKKVYNYSKGDTHIIVEFRK